MELSFFLDCMWLPLSEEFNETSFTFSRPFPEERFHEITSFYYNSDY